MSENHTIETTVTDWNELKNSPTNKSDLAFNNSELGVLKVQKMTYFSLENEIHGSSNTIPIIMTSRNVPETSKSLLEYSIFSVFFISLLIIAILILKKTFNLNNRKSSRNSSSRKPHRRRSVQRGYPHSIAIISSSTIHPELTYYYKEPRRILWESFYKSEFSQRDQSCPSPQINTCEKPQFCKLSPPSSLPNYTDAISTCKCTESESHLGLPTYNEAISVFLHSSVSPEF